MVGVGYGWGRVCYGRVRILQGKVMYGRGWEW